MKTLRWLIFLFFVMPVAATIAAIIAGGLFFVALELFQEFGWYSLMILVAVAAAIYLGILIVCVLEDYGPFPWKNKNTSERASREGV